MPSDTPDVAEWKRRAAEYERIIATFEKIGNEMRARRREATDSVMEMIDERLKLNDRTVNSMRLGLETVLREIKRVEAKRAGDG